MSALIKLGRYQVFLSDFKLLVKIYCFFFLKKETLEIPIFFFLRLNCFFL